MADSPISGLPETNQVNNNDLLLLEQGGAAKKISGANWKQYFNANVIGVATTTIQPNVAPSATYNQETRILTLNLPAADYIQSVSKTSTSGLVDTYTITTKLGYTATFTVTNAKSISSVTLQSGNHSPGTLDTYRINFNNSTHTDFQVYNGANGTGAPSSSTPKADSGTGVPGSSTDFSRSDHQHPKNVPTSGVPLADDGDGAIGDSTYYAAFNHKHPLNVPAPGVLPEMNGTAAIGDSSFYSSFDHVHPSDTSRAATGDVAYTNIDSISTNGLYRITGTGHEALITHINYDTNYAVQFGNFNANPNILMFRQKTGVPGVWGDWVSVSNKSVSVSLPYTGWAQVGSSDVYSMSITITGTTANTKVDLNPDYTALLQMMNDGTAAIYVANNSGSLTAYAVGSAPTATLTVNATLTEVV